MGMEETISSFANKEDALMWLVRSLPRDKTVTIGPLINAAEWVALNSKDGLHTSIAFINKRNEIVVVLMNDAGETDALGKFS